MPPELKVKVSITLPLPVASRLAVEAEDRGVPKSRVIVEALEQKWKQETSSD